MELLDPDALHCVTSWLVTADVVRLGSTCSRLRASVLDNDALWRSACVRDWGLGAPLDVGTGLAVWRRSHAAHGTAGAAYPHARRIWTRLEAFCARAFRPGLHSLRPGLTAPQVSAYERSLGVKLPAPYVASLLIHDGQDGCAVYGDGGAHASWHESAGLPLAGLLGGTSVYGETHVMGLTRALPHSAMLTEDLRDQVEGLFTSLVVVGDGRNLDDSGQGFLLLDTATGIVYALLHQARLVRVVSHAAALASHARHGLPPPESPHVDTHCWLRYLAELAERLEGGVFRVRSYAGDEEDGGGVSPAAAYQQWAASLYGGGAAGAAGPPAGAPVPATPLARVLRAHSRRTEAEAWVATLRANPLELAADFQPGGHRYVCAFAEAGPTTSVAVTAGVHVHVSAVLRMESTLRVHDDDRSVVAPSEAAADSAPPPPGFQRSTAAPAAPAACLDSDDGAHLRMSYRVRLWYDGSATSPLADEPALPPTAAAAPGPIPPTAAVAATSSGGGGGDGGRVAASDAAASDQLQGAVRLTSGHAPHASVQLASRRWVITDAAGVVDAVGGPGVVGLYPLLRPLPAGARCVAATTDPLVVVAAAASSGRDDGVELVNGLPLAVGAADPAQALLPPRPPRAAAAPGGGGGGAAAAATPPRPLLPEPFEYCSITGVNGASGVMRGSFAMVPGGLGAAARGGAFDAAVPAFHIGVPDFVYL